MTKKIVVFDLDETIGYFTQLSVFKYSIENEIKRQLKFSEFVLLLDLFKDYFRPDMFNIFNFLKEKKIKDNKIKVYIYTNNNGGRSWTYSIKRYIEHKLEYKLFDRTILSWKDENGKIIEKCRSGYYKSYKDLVKCGKLSKDDKICFLDDTQHNKMIHKNVYYIHLFKYKLKLSYEDMINKLFKSELKYIFKDLYISYNNILDYILEDESNKYVEHILKPKYNKKEILNEIKKFLDTF